MAPELGEKRLQLLKEMFPTVSHAMAVLWNPAYVGMRARFQQAQVAAPAVGLTVRSMEVRDSRELDVALEVMIREHPRGTFAARRSLYVQSAIAHSRVRR
jgi:ABC-type uncharacterized transport system substrate-binding protein